jgi:predicted RNase H-like HicB family nuclease
MGGPEASVEKARGCYTKPMQTFTAIIKNEGDYWIGWIEEVPGVNCQEESREELLETLQITLNEALEV